MLSVPGSFLPARHISNPPRRMLKRTKGRLLLTLLVVTGLAGTLNNSSISQKERKQALNLMKDSRNEIIGSVSGLTSKQLNYKHPGQLSISEIFSKMTETEEKWGKEINQIMQLPANAESRLRITVTDEQLTENSQYATWKKKALETVSTNGLATSQAIKKFFTLRNDHIKYIRNSTEDLRNHVVAAHAGWIDCYQYFLLLADQSSYFAQEIHKIKSLPQFPQK